MRWHKGVDKQTKDKEYVLIRFGKRYGPGFYDNALGKFILDDGGTISPEKVEWKLLSPLPEAE